MHPALRNGKIVSFILQSFDFNISCPADRHTCITVGLVCQTFLASALNELWRELFDLDALIKTIEGIKTIEFGELGDRGPRRQLFLDRLLLPAEIERLQYYSRRVEVFYHQDSCHATELFASIDASIITQIVSLLPSDEPLFPSLRRLHLGGSITGPCAATFTPHISKLFLSTSLKSISFGLSGSKTLLGAEIHSPNIWLFLRGVSRMSPQMLQYLDLGFVLHPRHLKPCFFLFTRIEFLRLPTGSHSFEALQCVSTLPNLLSLSISLGDWRCDPEELHVQKVPFRRVMILALDSSIESTRALFSYFCFPKMDKLEISHLDRDMVDEGCWEALLEHLVDDLPNLRSLTLDYRSRNPSQGLQSGQSFPWTCFDQLLQLPLLTDLSIYAPKVASLSNDNFSSMAYAWPDLTCLRIDTARLSGDIDFRVLIMVESRLPFLQSLVLSIDMPGAWVPIPPSSPHMLRRLQIPSLKDEDEEGHTPLSMVEQCEIAEFLDVLFPRLDVNSFYEGGVRERSGLGPLMDKLVKHLQDAGKRRAQMILRSPVDDFCSWSLYFGISRLAQRS